jgi:hypothetical protein
LEHHPPTTTTERFHARCARFITNVVAVEVAAASRQRYRARQVPASHRGPVTTSCNAESARYGAAGHCSTRTVLACPVPTGVHDARATANFG